MSRKVKTKKIPLSSLDKFLYFFMFFLGVFSLALIYPLGLILPNKIAASHAPIVASTNFIAVLCSIFISVTLSVSFFLIFGYGFTAKQPIFGNKKFKPKALTPILKTFPVFSKEFRNTLSLKTKRKIKKIVIIILIFLIISIIVFPFGLYPRTTLDPQNNISTYNSFNQLTRVDSIDAAQKLIISINTSGSRRGRRNYYISLEFVFENKSYKFSVDDFYELSTQQTLEYMLHLKTIFQNKRYEIANIEKIDELLFYENFTAEEQDLIYRLFDYIK